MDFKGRLLKPCSFLQLAQVLPTTLLIVRPKPKLTYLAVSSSEVNGTYLQVNMLEETLPATCQLRQITPKRPRSIAGVTLLRHLSREKAVRKPPQVYNGPKVSVIKCQLLELSTANTRILLLYCSSHHCVYLSE